MWRERIKSRGEKGSENRQIKTHQETTGRQEKYLKFCRHCQAENETCSHIIGNCPVVQDTRIERHNYICEILSKEAKKQDWTVFQEPHSRDDSNELYKPDLIFAKEIQAFKVDVTVWYKCTDTSLEEATVEKVNKYQHHHKHIQELTTVADIIFVSVLCGVQGKWYHRSFWRPWVTPSQGMRRQHSPWLQSTLHFCKYCVCVSVCKAGAVVSP